MKKLKMFTLLLTLTFLLGVSVIAHADRSSVGLNQEDVVSDDMCSTADAKTNGIVWANEETGDLHLDFSVRNFDKGACVQVTLFNADLEDDGSYADHDFDIKAADNPAWATDFHQEFNRSDAVRVFFIQMPNEDATIKVICGLPGHAAAGMVNYFYVGSASPDNGSKSGAPGFEFFMAFTALTAFAAVQVYRRKKKY